jgi:aerobic carbon-monoxide dehydrogenase medium subunit
VWNGRSGFALEEVARRHGDFALVGVVCGVTVDDAQLTRAAIALFGVGPTPVRATRAEEALLAGRSIDEAAAAATADIDPPDDLHASAAYRRSVAEVLVKRAVGRALEEARNA